MLFPLFVHPAFVYWSLYFHGHLHPLTNSHLFHATDLMADVINPVKGFVHSLSRICSCGIIVQITVDCFSSASPSLTSAVPSSTSFTMQRTSRSISVQRCTVKGWSVCSRSLCVCLTPLSSLSACFKQLVDFLMVLT